MSFKLCRPYTEIARECGVSKATISLIKTLRAPSNPCIESGRLKILKIRDVARLKRKVTLGANETAQKASKNHRNNIRQVSKSTESRELHSAGLHEENKLIKPALIDLHKRLKFELRKSDEPLILDSEKVIFSDETKIYRYGSDVGTGSDLAIIEYLITRWSKRVNMGEDQLQFGLV
jgi:hypothetical protein